MTFDEILEAINNAKTQETILEIKTNIALSCDNDEITEAEYHELRDICDLSLELLPSEQSAREAEKDDLEETYRNLTKF
jgi:hypothetical protein